MIFANPSAGDSGVPGAHWLAILPQIPMRDAVSEYEVDEVSFRRNHV